jgi:hypothetical protein
MYEYIRCNKIGKRLKVLTVIIGHYPSVFGNIFGPDYRVPVNSWIRALVAFTCYEDSDLNIVIADDAKEDENVWNHYFDEKRLADTPGLTIPRNLDDLIAAGKEMDWILAASENIPTNGSDMESLFGSSPEPESLHCRPFISEYQSRLHISAGSNIFLIPNVSRSMTHCKFLNFHMPTPQLHRHNGGRIKSSATYQKRKATPLECDSACSHI